MSPLAVFFRTLSRSSAICLGVGLAIVNPAWERSPTSQASVGMRAQMEFAGVTAQNSPTEAAIDGLIFALKDSDAGVRRQAATALARAAQSASGPGTDRGAQGSRAGRQASGHHRRSATSPTRGRPRRWCRRSKMPSRAFAHGRRWRSAKCAIAPPSIRSSPSSAIATSRSGAGRSWRSVRSATSAPFPPSPRPSKTTIRACGGPRRWRWPSWRSRWRTCMASAQSAPESQPEPESQSESKPQPESQPAATRRSLTCFASSLVPLRVVDDHPLQRGRPAIRSSRRSRSAKELIAELAATDASVRTRAACGLRELGDRAADAIGAARRDARRRVAGRRHDLRPAMVAPRRGESHEPWRRGGRGAGGHRHARVPAGACGAQAGRLDRAAQCRLGARRAR